MDVFDQLAPVGSRPSAVTIGVFDGIHLGHQSLIRETVGFARERGLAAGVVTFADHPLSVLAPPFCPKKLIYPDRKLNLLDELGVDFVVLIPFTREFAGQTPEEFVEGALVTHCGARAVVCGHDFSFGRQGAGNVDMLRQLGLRHGFEVVCLDSVVAEEMFVRSTMIRDLLYTGQVEKAHRLLTRAYELRGAVKTGFGRGRQIGFPTANVAASPAHVVPGRGVYACAAVVAGEPQVHGAMVNVGYNPTFGNDVLTVEAHLLDTVRDLAGGELKLFFLARLRDEQKFPGVEALVVQLCQDREQSRRLLGTEDSRRAIREIEILEGKCQ